MREFMHHITTSFFAATKWNEDNSYKELNATARELIDFSVPRGLRLTLSSLATPHLATSYQLGSVGVVDGFISYLFSSIALTNAVARSEAVPLPSLLRAYRPLRELDIAGRRTRRMPRPALLPHLPRLAACDEAAAIAATGPDAGTRRRGTLLYGRLYLPHSQLEGLIIKRLAQALQVQVSAVSQESLKDGGTLLGLVQYDRGKFGVEGLASTDGGLLGVRGIYNFGGDASLEGSDSDQPGHKHAADRDKDKDKERIYGRFSAGGELYYGTLNKSGGVSLGLRFATLPAHRGTPLAASLTLNPLMGNISASYAVVVRRFCSLAARMDFNVYSYESEWAVGTELWSRRKPAGFVLGAAGEVGGPEQNQQQEHEKAVLVVAPRTPRQRSFHAKLAWRLDGPDDKCAGPEDNGPGQPVGNEYRGVWKARLDNKLRLGIVWEGRVQSLIFSLGSGIDLHRLYEPFRSLGLGVQYSS